MTGREFKTGFMNQRNGLKKQVEREVQNYSDESPTSQQREPKMRDRQLPSGPTALDPETVENHKENVIQ